MKTVGIVLIGAAALWAGCACDCADGVGTANGMVPQDNVLQTNQANRMQGNGTYQDTSTSANNVTNRGNSATDTTDNAGRSATTATDPNYNKKTKDDPRTYGTSSGGVGYRNDTIDAYKGIDGTARDKDHGGTSPR